jgi:hypothetical protein
MVRKPTLFWRLVAAGFDQLISAIVTDSIAAHFGYCAVCAAVAVWLHRMNPYKSDPTH